MSLITFINSLFGKKAETSSKLVENTSNEEVYAIIHAYDINDVRHPLNPLRLKCESGFGTSMMCFTY